MLLKQADKTADVMGDIQQLSDKLQKKDTLLISYMGETSRSPNRVQPSRTQFCGTVPLVHSFPSA